MKTLAETIGKGFELIAAELRANRAAVLQLRTAVVERADTEDQRDELRRKVLEDHELRIKSLERGVTQ